MKRIEIRKAALADLEPLTSLFDQYRIFYKQESDLKGAEDFLRERIVNSESTIFYATEKREQAEIPVGFTQLYPSFSSASMKRLWILNDLFVAHEFRRQGVAEKLMARARAFVEENGGKRLTLATAHDNHAAQRLYGKCGYVRVEDFWYYHLNV